MATHTLGRVGVVDQGGYSSTKAYAALDMVSHQNAVYIAKLASTGIVPTNTSYWMLAAQSTGTNTSDATAAATDILRNKTAYISSGKVAGTIDAYAGSTSVTPTTTSQILPTANRYCSSNIVVGAASSGGGSSLLKPSVSVAANKLTVTFARAPFTFWIRFKTSSNSYMLSWNSENKKIMQSTNSGGIHEFSTIEWPESAKAVITLRNDSNSAFAASVMIDYCYGA